MVRRSWRTTLLGILAGGLTIAGHVWPKYRAAAEVFVPLILGGGLIAAKDFNVSGGDK